MLSKCANPGCTASFLYLHQGKLFRLETEDTGDGPDLSFGEDPGVKKSARRIEFFWLCNDCAAAMTLAFKKGVGVTTKPLALAKAQKAAS